MYFLPSTFIAPFSAGIKTLICAGKSQFGELI
jgi:hypothetical protein